MYHQEMGKPRKWSTKINLQPIRQEVSTPHVEQFYLTTNDSSKILTWIAKLMPSSTGAFCQSFFQVKNNSLSRLKPGQLNKGLILMTTKYGNLMMSLDIHDPVIYLSMSVFQSIRHLDVLLSLKFHSFFNKQVIYKCTYTYMCAILFSKSCCA